MPWRHSARHTVTCEEGTMRYVVIGMDSGIHALEMIRARRSGRFHNGCGWEPFSPYCRPMIQPAPGGSHSGDRDLPIRPRILRNQWGRAVVGERVEHIDVETGLSSRTACQENPLRQAPRRLGCGPGGHQGPGPRASPDLLMRNQAHVQGMVLCLPEVKGPWPGRRSRGVQGGPTAFSGGVFR